MNLPAISLRDLEYLVAVAEHGHFGRAARACHVSQPALSGQVKKAEEILGQTVFERTNRRVSLTDPGRAIVQQAKVVLEEARRLAQLGATRRGPFDGHLSLGAIASVGPYLLPHLLRPLRKHYPQLQLVIKEGLTETLIEDLRAGALDAAIASPTFDSHGLHEFPLFFEPFLLAAPHGHALAK
ncbi:MAG: LysR family transcriptional regulator, partial [Bacteriovoracia bacterium]